MPKKEKFPQEGIILAEDEQGNKTIIGKEGYHFIAVKGSINATPLPVGTKGKINWMRSASYSLPYFTKD